MNNVPLVSTQITLAMIHFVQPTRFPSSAVEWTLWPEGRILRRAELAHVLELMPKPVIVSAHAEQGGLTVVPLVNMAPDRRAWLDYQCRNQIQYFREKLGVVLPGARSESVLIELDDNELLVSIVDLETWTREYVLTSCGWTLSRDTTNSRAPLRMLLRRPDGHWSPHAWDRDTTNTPPNEEL